MPTTSWRICGSSTLFGTPDGTVTNIANLTADDGNNVTWTDPNDGGGAFSEHIIGYNFGFDAEVPANAHIDNVEWRIGDIVSSSNMSLSSVNFFYDCSTSPDLIYEDTGPNDTITTTPQIIDVTPSIDFGINVAKLSFFLPNEKALGSDFGLSFRIGNGVSDGSTCDIDYLASRITYHVGFPTPVSRWENQHGNNRPFMYKGDLYVVTWHEDRPNVLLKVLKTSNPKLPNWTELDVANGPSENPTSQDFIGLETCADGDTLHIVRWGFNSGSCTYDYHQFDLATGTWGRTDVVESGIDPGGVSGFARIIVRPDGDVFLLYQGAVDRIMGGDKLRIDYAVFNGTSWSAGNALDAAGDIHYGNPVCCLGTVSNDVHFAWMRQTDTANDPPTAWSDFEGRTFRANDTLSTTSTQAVPGGTTVPSQVVMHDLIQVGGGSMRSFVYTPTAAGDLLVKVASEDGSDDFSWDATVYTDGSLSGNDVWISNDLDDLNGSIAIHSTVRDPSNGNLYMLYIGGGAAGVDRNLRLRVSKDDGQTWSDELVKTLTDDGMEVSLGFFTRSEPVLGFVYSVTGTSTAVFHHNYDEIPIAPFQTLFKPRKNDNTLLRM